jgi:hypothetical protein
MRKRSKLVIILVVAALSAGIFLGGCDASYNLSPAPPGVSDYATPYNAPSPIILFPLQRPGFESLAYPGGHSQGRTGTGRRTAAVRTSSDFAPAIESQLLNWPPYIFG